MQRRQKMVKRIREFTVRSQCKWKLSHGYQSVRSKKPISKSSRTTSSRPEKTSTTRTVYQSSFERGSCVTFTHKLPAISSDDFLHTAVILHVAKRDGHAIYVIAWGTRNSKLPGDKIVVLKGSPQATQLQLDDTTYFYEKNRSSCYQNKIDHRGGFCPDDLLEDLTKLVGIPGHWSWPLSPFPQKCETLDPLAGASNNSPSESAQKAPGAAKHEGASSMSPNSQPSDRRTEEFWEGR